MKIGLFPCLSVITWCFYQTGKCEKWQPSKFILVRLSLTLKASWCSCYFFFFLVLLHFMNVKPWSWSEKKYLVASRIVWNDIQRTLCYWNGSIPLTVCWDLLSTRLAVTEIFRPPKELIHSCNQRYQCHQELTCLYGFINSFLLKNIWKALKGWSIVISLFVTVVSV